MKQPCPPPHLLQHIANNPNADDFIRSFEYLRHEVKRYLKEAGFDFAKFNTILDFGCGAGRFMFAFRDELRPGQKLWGCDVYEECARWCQRNIDFAEVAHSDIEPPLPYEDEQFDFLYALSVFTHLRLDLQFRWAWETHRVLRPGGVLFATTHGPLFIPMLYETESAGRQRTELYSFGEESLFAYLSFFGKSEDEGQVDVVAAHTAGFFKEQFSAFELVKRFAQSNLAGEQDLYILRKPEHGRIIARPIPSRTKRESEQWLWREDLTADGNHLPVTLRFNLNGHRSFHVYPKIEPAGFYGVDCRIEIKSGDRDLTNELVPFNNNRVYGKTHYAAIELHLPEHTGEVTVHLSSVISKRGMLPVGSRAEVAWCFPNFT